MSSVIKTLVEEATFEASGEALTFRAMDPSHIALVDLYWPRARPTQWEPTDLIALPWQPLSKNTIRQLKNELSSARP